MSSCVPSHFWREVVYTFIYLINKTLLSVFHGQTPFQQLFCQPPIYSHICVFGSTCFVLLPQSVLSYPTSLHCVFLGYESNKKDIDVMMQWLRSCTFQEMTFF